MTISALILALALAGPSAEPVAAQAAAAPAQAAQPSPGEALGEAYFLFLRGQRLERRGEVTSAIAAFKRASELAPGAAEIRAELAAVYARAGRATDAVREGDAALAIDPDNREAHRILGLVQAALADRLPAGSVTPMVTQAIGHLEKALAGGRRDPGMEITLGRLYVREGKYLPAIRTLRAFLLAQPGYPDAMILLAEAFTGNREPAEAVAVLEELVREAPDDLRALPWLADLYEETGQWDKAAASWAALATRSPGDTSHRIRQATALVNGGNLDRAREVLTALTTSTPDDVMGWYLLSQVERRTNRLDAAEAAARRILSMNAEDARGLLALAEVLGARGDYPGVVRTLEARVASPRPADAGAVHSRLAVELAVALQSSGQAARAVSVLEAALARTPDDGDLLFDLGAAYERASQFDAAEQTFRRVIVAEPRHGAALNYLGYMLADRGQKLDEALSLIRRALEAEPDNPSYLDSLGWAYFKSGRAEEAREPLVRAAGARPRSSIIQEHLGDVCFALKEYRAAADAFERALTGDREGIDAPAVTKKRDRARALAGH